MGLWMTYNLSYRRIMYGVPGTRALPGPNLFSPCPPVTVTIFLIPPLHVAYFLSPPISVRNRILFLEPSHKINKICYINSIQRKIKLPYIIISVDCCLNINLRNVTLILFKYILPMTAARLYPLDFILYPLVSYPYFCGLVRTCAGLYQELQPTDDRDKRKDFMHNVNFIFI